MARERGRSAAAKKQAGGGTGKEAAAAPRNGAGTLERMIDLDFVRGLIAAVDESGIDSLELRRAGTRIRIAKTPPPAPAAPAGAPMAMVHAPAAEAGPATSVVPAPPEAPSGEEAAASNLVDVKSPMVGTFYRAPAPEAPAYVEVGTSVSKGQTLCILEAMKLMNELESEVDGVIREILVDNADPVEFGQVLFRVEPEMGIRTVAVYSEVDRESLHVRFADEDICIGPPPARESYLNIPRIIAAAEITGAEAIHPGYGFLAENAEFAEICERSDIVFIGPTAEQIRLMGDKAVARRTMARSSSRHRRVGAGRGCAWRMTRSDSWLNSRWHATRPRLRSTTARCTWRSSS
jgi:acetyl-CoA carboxylase biotin carboxyl carrier protein